MSALKQVIDCVHGSPLPTYPGEELSAAKRLLADPRMTVARVSKIMAFCSSHRVWSGVVVSVCKLETHLVKILEQMRQDPASEGDLAGWQAHQPYADPTPDEYREAKGESLKTPEQRRAEAYAPWQALVDEAHSLGLTGPAMARWVFAERERRTGKPGIAVAANKLLDAFVGKANDQAAQRRGSVQPQRVADTAAPKAAQREDQPRSWQDSADTADAEEGRE